jgi:ribosomal protein S18 acetylase RimI-like enzyme
MVEMCTSEDSSSNTEILVIKPTENQLKWMIDLAIRNVTLYCRTGLLHYSKAYSIRKENNIYVVYYVDKLPLGFAIVSRNRHVLNLSELHVMEGYRSIGIGTSLLKFCKREFFKHPFNKMMVTCYNQNIGAIKFYTKIGFKVADDVPNDLCYTLMSCTK